MATTNDYGSAAHADSAAPDSRSVDHHAMRKPMWQEEIVTRSGARKLLALARITIGFYFLWAFLDKMFGLTFTTPPEQSVLNGGAPAQGYIDNVAANGPLGGFFQLFANPFGDWLFMLGLLGLGIALLLGAGLKIAAVAGVLLLFFMYLAAPPWWGEHGTNPIVDSHILYMFLVALPAATLAGDTWGLGRWWGRKVGNGILR